MWRIVNESLSELCSSAFWDSNITWNTQYPRFSTCFEKTFLSWFPCAFLWLFLPAEIYYLRHSKAWNIPFRLYNIFKLITITILELLSFIDVLVYVLFKDGDNAVDIYKSSIESFSFVLFFCLTYANMKHGIRSSGVLFVFSMLLVFCGMSQFLSDVRLGVFLYSSNESTMESEPIIRLCRNICYYVLTLIIFGLNCFPDGFPSNRSHTTEKKVSPEDDASFVSRILFAWFDPIMWRGYRRTLIDEDVWTLGHEMRTATLSARLESNWQLEVDKLKKSRNSANVTKVSIFRPLLATFGPTLMLGVVIKLLELSISFANPFMLSLIIEFVASRDEFMWHGYFYAIVLFVISILQTIFMMHQFQIMDRVGLQIRTSLMSLIYKKSLKLSNAAKGEFTLGEIVNLMAVDAQRFVAMAVTIHGLWIGPLVSIVVVYFLWRLLGPYSALASLGMMIIFMPINAVVASKNEKLHAKQMEWKDKRVKLMGEILSGIKILKLYAWESGFEKQITQIRDKEIEILKGVTRYEAGNSFICDCAPFMVSLVAFAIHVLSNENNVFDARVAFVCMSLFSSLNMSLAFLPYSLSSVVQSFVAMKRINKFLNLEELDMNAISHDPLSEPVFIENGKFSWESERGSTVLSNINVKVKSGNLVAIIGPVGSGKSSLLSAILGDMYKQFGFVNTTGSFAYVPQQAWIRNDTLKNNITFGENISNSVYNEVLEACALNADLKTLPDGDETEIGEKGVNLSGGQKQRVSIARAVYFQADTYLLDDSLSAVDAHVGKHIFDQVIGPKGLLREKTRIFVTHNLGYLSQVDYIYVLENGSISESGTYDGLLEQRGNFAELIMTFLRQEKDNLEKKKDTKMVIPSRRCKHWEEGSHLQRVNRIERDFQPGKAASKSEIENKKGKKLIESEKTEVGNIKRDVYAYYLKAIGALFVGLVILFNVLYQVFSVASSYWLSVWSDNDVGRVTEQYFYLGVYTLLGLLQAVSIMSETVALCTGVLKAAKNMHDRLLRSILHWPVITFDSVPLGRIINRFACDIDILDNFLPKKLVDTLLRIAKVMSNLFVIVCSTPMILNVVLPLAVAYFFSQRFYIRTSRQLKRLESVSRSPIYSHFSDTISGVESIRAYGLRTKFIRQSEKTIDDNLKNYYANVVAIKWLNVRLQMYSSLIIFFSTLLVALNRDTLTPAAVGFCLSYTLEFWFNMFYWLQLFSEAETNIVSVERIKDLNETEQEAQWVVQNENVPENWPSRGEIEFHDLDVRYRGNLDPVLKGISFNVRSGEKVGIVGRTGAGKSSLALCLFRVIEACSGRIVIDDIDISKIGLQTLRSQLTIIPQDLVLFSGTLRMNLDPNEIFTDENLWNALDLANLKTYVSRLDSGLEYVVTEGGNNFSVGQKQLICLARALLRKTKVLILDEATAAVDLETDDLIQATIRREFKDSTILTIAHRLNTILDYDRVLLLDESRIIEYDRPITLLNSEKSVFYRMAKDAGLV